MLDIDRSTWMRVGATVGVGLGSLSLAVLDSGCVPAATSAVDRATATPNVTATRRMVFALPPAPSREPIPILPSPTATRAIPYTTSRPVEAPPAKETGKLTYIWFVGSSTIDNFHLIEADLKNLFPEPRFRILITGKRGYHFEELTREIENDSLFPVFDKAPVDPSQVDYIVAYAGANDIFDLETKVGMEEETVAYLATIAKKYPNAKLMIGATYPLGKDQAGRDKYQAQNSLTDNYDLIFTQGNLPKLISEIEEKAGRRVSLSIFDVRSDIASCNPLSDCYLDDRHVSVPILRDMAGKIKNEIDPGPDSQRMPPYASIPIWRRQDAVDMKRARRANINFRGNRVKYW